MLGNEAGELIVKINDIPHYFLMGIRRILLVVVCFLLSTVSEKYWYYFLKEERKGKERSNQIKKSNERESEKDSIPLP